MKKKLKLKDLKIQSFVTTVDKPNKQEMRGGTGGDIISCLGIFSCSCPNPCGIYTYPPSDCLHDEGCGGDGGGGSPPADTRYELCSYGCQWDTDECL